MQAMVMPLAPGTMQRKSFCGESLGTGGNESSGGNVEPWQVELGLAFQGRGEHAIRERLQVELILAGVSTSSLEC